MGLLQKAVETYDENISIIGKEIEGKATLSPVHHMTTAANIEITVDNNGSFVSAVAVDKKAPKIIIPVTETSAGRTSGICAHPLCEQLKYIADYKRLKSKDEECFTVYIEQLQEWVESVYSHPMLEPIFKYVMNKTILSDLERSGIIKIDENGAPENEKFMVCWRVVGIGEDSGAVYNSISLFKSYINYIESKKDISGLLCMVSGHVSKPAEQHPKGIIPLYGNAKLISSNDSANFTYRGRFIEPDDAASISSVSSQKLHNALKWVAANQGINIGGRIFLCWNPKGYDLPDVFDPLLDNDEKRTSEPTEYGEQLSRILLGFKARIPEDQGAVIASFDAATTGRLSLTYYSELLASDLIERIAHWDRTCCFCGWYYGQYGISAPDLRNIIRYAFGTQRGDDNNARIECDDKIMRQHVQRLLSCRADGAKFPFDIMAALVKNASNPLAYNTQNRNTVNFISCAIIRKYKYDNFKEEWEMALEPEKRDLSYQYGRLLAVMEKAERDTYDSSESREPNAIRMQSVFCQRPAYAAKTVIEQLKKSYLPRLTPGTRIFYDQLMGQIFEQISMFPESEHNRALKETYLLGYYLQKNALYTKREKADDDN